MHLKNVLYFLLFVGDTEGDLFWKFIVSKIKKPSAQLVECQKPKPILLPVGEVKLKKLLSEQIKIGEKR